MARVLQSFNNEIKYLQSMTREKAKELALEMVNKEIAKYGEEHIVMQAPQRGKSSWTAKEIKESIINDTVPEGCTCNLIDDILRYHKYYEDKD